MNTCLSWWVTACMLASGAAVAASVDQPLSSKVVRLVVPFPPGGVSDLMARLMREPLSRGLGQKVVVENRPGANTIIAAEAVARAPADGYILLMGSTVMLAVLRSNLPFDPIRDFAAVASLGTQPFAWSVHPSVPVRSIEELIALARARPGELAYSTNGYGTIQHLTAELFMARAGISMKHVVFQGGVPSVMAVVGGHVGVVLSGIAPIVDHVRSGRLRALAVTSSRRSAVLGGVPTVMASGLPDFEMTGRLSVMTKAATPKATIDRLSAELMRVALLPEIKVSMARVGYEVDPVGADELAADILIKVERLKQLAKAANIKLD